VGFIALAGLAADDGIVMASFIHQRLQQRRIETVPELRQEIYEAGLKRIRPCVMTTLTTIAALLPVLLSEGRGSDVARAMAWECWKWNPPGWRKSQTIRWWRI